MLQKTKKHFRQLTAFVVGLVLISVLSSCSTLNRFIAHGGACPVYVNSMADKYYIDGKETEIHMDIYRQTTEGNIQTTTYHAALRIPPKTKFVSFLRVEPSGKKTMYLCRRKPIYLYFWFDQFLSLDLGTLIDIADNLIYDWEIVAVTEIN